MSKIKTAATGRESLLAAVKPSKAIIKLAIPATLALVAKAVYNIVDTVYIGMLNDDLALASVGVILPLLLIFSAIENIFAAGAGVLAGRQLGAEDGEGASSTVSTVAVLSVILGLGLGILGIIFMEPLLRMFGASDAVLPMAKDYAFWMFVAAVANIPAQSLNFAARAESSVKITSVAIITGALLNVVLDPIFIFDWGFGLGVVGASLATTISQFVALFIILWYYLSGRSIVRLKLKSVRFSTDFFKTVISIGVPTAIVQICLAVSASFTNMAAAGLPDSDLIIAAYGVVQRLILIGCFIVTGLMQGYQPVAAYAFGAKNEERLRDSMKFTLKASLILSLIVSVLYISLSKPLIMVFNRNPVVIEYGTKLLISQMALYVSFGFCYMMTITFQTIGASKFGVFLSAIRQGIFYLPFVLILPRFFGIRGIYFSQPCADILTIGVCLLSYKTMKKMASASIKKVPSPELEEPSVQESLLSDGRQDSEQCSGADSGNPEDAQGGVCKTEA